MKKNNKGCLLIFEGLDGAGKTTHITKILNHFISDGYKTWETREPGGTEVGEEIRKILKSNIDMAISTQAYLFASSRNQNNIEIVNKVNQGYIVLCDRHYLSSLVYQGSIARMVNECAMDLLKDIETHIILFDVNYDTFLQRMNIRNKNDRYETVLEDEIHFDKWRNKYLDYAKKFKAIIVDTSNIDSSNIEEENEKLYKKILEMIKEDK